eukprot:gene16641-22741_t
MTEYMSTASQKDYLAFDSEHRLRAENLSFDIDVWYPKLQSYTFRSIFIPIKVEEAKAIQSFSNVSWRNVKDKLDKREVNCLKELEATIDAELSSHFADNNGNVNGFIRLCGRSPKDGEPLHREKVYNIYQMELNRLVNDEGYQLNANTKMIALTKTSTLHVSNGAEAISLLLTSERVYAEMIDWLRFGEPEQICIREWEPDLSMDYEFRCFCYRGKFTCVSQYDHYTYYPYLSELTSFLTQGIMKLWLSFHEKVNENDSSYVFDVAYLKKSDRFVLVELSPFTPCTGPALFHWQYDKDLIQGVSLSSDYCYDNIISHIKNIKQGIKQGFGDEEDYNIMNDYISDLSHRIPGIVFKLKQECDLHPQLDEIVEINWDFRWKEERLPYHYYYNNKEESDINNNEYLTFSFASFWNNFTKMLSFSPASSNTLINSNEIVRNPVLLFVYGTLKNNFYWNKKYLHERLGAKYIISAATCDKYCMIVGHSGVPYLLNDDLLNTQNGHNNNDNNNKNNGDIKLLLKNNSKVIIGELWEINDDILKGLDDYEGIKKNYYIRKEINVSGYGYSDDVQARNDYYYDRTVIHTAHVYMTNNLSIFQDQITQQLSTTPSSAQSMVTLGSDSLFLSEYTLSMHEASYKPIQHIQVKQNNYIQKPSTWGKVDETVMKDLTSFELLDS